MTSNTDTKDLQKLEGKKFRFVVKSAEEAVRVIKERLGERAKVLSVNQISGQGLARFLSSPKLEIIATLAVRTPPPETTTTQAITVNEEKTANISIIEEKKQHEVPKKETNENSVSKKQEDNNNIPHILERAGFERSFLSTFKGHEFWENIQKKTISHALQDLVDALRETYGQLQPKEYGPRIAFLGVPGCGKTSALCKQLTQAVFMCQETVQVLKVENDTPNADDSLRVFCEVLNVPLLRDRVDLDWIENDKKLYLDTPGIALQEADEWHSLKKNLDSLQVNTRVWIMNAAYETDFLKRSLDIGQYMECTHVVLTHLDETNQAAKLWAPILRSGLTPLFASHGQSITGAYTDRVLECLLNKTFPSIVAKE